MILTHSIEELIAPTALWTVFQPIFDITTDRPVLVAAEALTRGPRGTHFESASVLFEYIRLKGAEVASDRCCITSAFERAAGITALPMLTVNVHATTIERDADLAAFIAATAAKTGVDLQRVVIEIVEQASYFDEKRLRAMLRELRALGLRIAVDDLGFGNGNYRLILDSRPEYLKIDRHFVDGCAHDPYRRALLRSILHLGNDCGAQIIAEGIETIEDLVALRDLGIPGGQGYLLGRPTATPQFDTHRMDSRLDTRSTTEERAFA